MTERDEADFIAREIGRLTAAGGAQPADIVVFYRVNAQSRVIEEALVRRRIPYYIVGGLRFYDHREIKDLLAYLRVMLNPADAVSARTDGRSADRAESAPRRWRWWRRIAAEEGVTLFEAMGRLETESSVALRIGQAGGRIFTAGCAI